MAWIELVKKWLELIGALATAFYLLSKLVIFMVKLYMIVSERKLKLNGSSELNKVYSEREK